MRGFDTGPGNVLLDLWSLRQRNAPYDDAGAWAASGTIDYALLALFLAEPYFVAPPPKSTGRDLFNAGWLDRRLAQANWTGRAEDVQATLSALTARTLADAVRAHCEGAQELLICGGGAKNAQLRRLIEAELPRVHVASTDTAGIASEHVEALAFAWLARETLAGRPGNLPAVTGAKGPARAGGDLSA